VEHAAVFRLIAGLGNPGRQYAGTRHNAGFFVLDELARRAAATFQFDTKWNADVANCGGRTLMKPQTFMNLSGDSVGGYLRYHRLDPTEVLVVFDDTALPLGDLRIRRSGSAGGHNGLRSIIARLGTEEVPRLRVGIGAAPSSLHNYVLGRFSEDELPVLEASVSRAADAIAYASEHGLDAAMNIYNKKHIL
jgi:PTH1 family peptidyl-tRNA hydrolase